MAKGKAKGFKKVSVKIQEPCMGQYYLLNEDNQFVVMRDGSGIPVGYHSKLGTAIRSIAKKLTAESNNQTVMSLGEFVESYENISNNLIKSINI